MFRELLAREFAPFGSLTAQQLDLLEAHHNLLGQWNVRLNLTRIDSLEETVRLHYCESLFVGIKLPVGPLRIVDVGSGAGFPGIPIAILRPDCFVSLVESHKRKAVFLSEASRNLSNVSVVTDRAENLKHEYDWLVSRAVSPDDLLKLKLANNLALLVGNEKLPGFNRREAVPWGASRYLMFHVERSC
jgi:16S rRNA (guanine(527)-N(7))-methyltransferase RsmG